MPESEVIANLRPEIRELLKLQKKLGRQIKQMQEVLTQMKARHIRAEETLVRIIEKEMGHRGMP